MTEFETNVTEFRSIPCQLGIGFGHARRCTSKESYAELIERHFPQGELEAKYHRETNDGIDLCFYKILTGEDRLNPRVLFDFADNFNDVDYEMTMERARRENPALFDEEDEGTIARILDINQDKIINLFARPIGDTPEEARGEVMVELKAGIGVSAKELPRLLPDLYRGELHITEKIGRNRFLTGGPLVTSIQDVRDVVNAYGDEFGLVMSDFNVICRVTDR